MATNDPQPTYPVRRFVLTWDAAQQTYVVRELPTSANDVTAERYPVIMIVVPMVEERKA